MPIGAIVTISIIIESILSIGSISAAGSIVEKRPEATGGIYHSILYRAGPKTLHNLIK